VNRTVAVIQARTGSSRLPGKVLAPLYGEISLLAFQCRRLKQIEGVDQLVIATSDQPGDDAIVELGAAEGVRVIRGSERDVLARFVKAAEASFAKTLIRITADSPLRDPEVIARCLDQHRAANAEYTRPAADSLPKGLRAEVVESSVLIELDADPMLAARYREHVTLYVRENPDRYITATPDFAPELARPDYDVSVDTPQDLEFVRALYQELLERGWPVDAAHICRTLDDRHITRWKERA
jgi:spore coat polysaccharide biosynthesis protein SpsF